MNLLIVDDQYSVLQGLKTGIQWRDTDISHVFYAMSTLEAKMILEQNVIDILLCDIEMPGEDGLSLIRWMNDKKLMTKCILLTAHSNFEYAKEGYKLGVIDYIVQPAAYDDIKKTVIKAVAMMKEDKTNSILKRFGKILSMNKQQMARDALRNLINENFNAKEIHSLVELGVFPAQYQDIYLGIYQILAWSRIGTWETRLITDTLDNIGSEIFGTFEQKFIITPINKNSYIFIVWDEKTKVIRDYMEHQLKFFLNISSQFLDCRAAVYFDGSLKPAQCNQSMEALKQMKADNIAFRDGVFVMKKGEIGFLYPYKNQDIRYWGDMLKEGHGSEVRKNALSYLDELEENDGLNADTLRRFYLDFMQAAYYASQALNIHLYDLFKNEENDSLYMESVHSVTQMKELVSYIIAGFENIAHKENAQNNIVELAKEYIREHMSVDIRRDELAAYVHVSPDYLTRIFKKETGLSLKEYVINEKMKEAKSLLEQTDLPIGVVAAMVGYYNFSYFSQTYKKVIGISPSQEKGETADADGH